MHTQVNIWDVVIHPIGLGQLWAKILCPNLTPMHSLFHMRNLKFLPKFYARILHQGIVFFHMRSTRATKSNNKLGSATWVLGKKSELIWRWEFFAPWASSWHNNQNKRNFFSNFCFVLEGTFLREFRFLGPCVFLKRSLKFEKFFILGGSNRLLAVLGFWGPFSIFSRPCAECKVSSHFFPLYILIFHCAEKILFADVVITSNKLWSSLQHCAFALWLS